jgi:hypothetical protein
MKNNTKFTLPAILLALAVTACSHVSPRYNPSATNVEGIRDIAKGAISKINVDQFSATEKGKKSIGCRAEGTVSAPDNKTFDEFIKDAISDELRVAGIFDAKSPIKLQGNLDYIDFSSNIGAGKWVMKMTFKSEGIEPFMVENTYEFSTNFIANIACEQVSQALAPASQDLIKRLIEHPSFKKIVTQNQNVVTN